MPGWSGPAITAKLLLPVILICIVGIGSVPAHDVWAAAWIAVIVIPTIAAAIWLFINIGELRACQGGVLYRRWIAWQRIPSSQISNIKRTFPCLAALFLSDGSKLFFFPDPETKRMLRSFQSAAHEEGTDADTLPAHRIVSLLLGVVVGIAIRQIPAHGAGTRSIGTTTVLRIEHFYLPVFIVFSITYLIALCLLGRLKPWELRLSLSLVGLGVVYVSTVFLHAL